MALVSNVNRVATANALAADLDCLVRLAGLVVQTHRAYESGSKGQRGLRQQEVAARALVSKTLVSQLERGVNIPRSAALRRILRATGMHMGRGSAGRAFCDLLCAIRDYRPGVRRLAKETPP